MASRTPENARAFAKSLNIAEAAPSYEAAVSADVEAVYIATPPALHEAHATLALNAGKPVLVEKPFASDAAAARRIADLAKNRGLFCMEAMWTRFQPLIETVSTRITAGDLGEVKSFSSAFCAANQPDAGSSLFNPALGGGALMHRGIYPLSLASYLLGPITEMRTMAQMGESGADEESVIVLRHDNGALSTIRASLRTQTPDRTVIAGTKGTVVLEGPVYRPTDSHLLRVTPAPAATGQASPRRFETFRESAHGLALSRLLARIRQARRREKISAPFKGNGYHYQAIAVAEALAAGHITSPKMPLSESINLLEFMDKARQDWAAKL